MRKPEGLLLGLIIVMAALPAIAVDGGEESPGPSLALRWPHELLSLETHDVLVPTPDLVDDALGPSSDVLDRVEWLSITGQSTAPYEQVYDLARDAQGNIVMVGTAYGGSSGNYGDIVVGKWAPNGQASWVKRYNASRYDQGQGVATDAQGNIVVVGSKTSPNGTSQAHIVMFDGLGRYLWSRSLPRELAQDHVAVAVAMAPTGDLVVAGIARGFPVGNKTDWRTTPFVTALRPADGAPRWTQLLPHGTSEVASDVVVATSGDIFVAGYLYTWPAKGTLTKLTTEGNETARLLLDQGGQTALLGIALDPTGNLVVAGATNSGILAARLTPALGLEWQQAIEDPTRHAYAYDVAVDKLSHIVLGGSMWRSCCGSDGFVAKLRPDGMPLFLRPIDAGSYDSIAGVATTPYGGEILSGGTSYDTYQSGSGADLTLVRSLGVSALHTPGPVLQGLPSPDPSDTPIPLPPLP